MRRRFLGLALFCGLLYLMLAVSDNRDAYARLLADPSISFDGKEGDNPSSPKAEYIKATGTFDLAGSNLVKVRVWVRVQHAGNPPTYGGWTEETPTMQGMSFLFEKNGYTKTATYQVKASLTTKKPPAPELTWETEPYRLVTIKN
jgi:hypothetical protein